MLLSLIFLHHTIEDTCFISLPNSLLYPLYDDESSKGANTVERITQHIQKKLYFITSNTTEAVESNSFNQNKHKIKTT